MWKALSILHSAVTGEGLDSPTTSTSPIRSLSSFDAHVGDCACHTRAQMLWELVHFYSIPKKQDDIKHAITMLQEIRIQAASLLRLIESKSRIPELNALTTYGSVWNRIGFTRFLDLFYGTTGSPLTTSEDLQCMLLSKNGPSFSQCPFPDLTPQRPHSSHHRHRRITVEAAWDINNLFLVARFLTLCLLLSEYKIARVKPGSPIRIMVRVNLQLMYAEIENELEALDLLSSRKRSNNCDRKTKMTVQCEAIQIYVSLVTTDWVRKAALRLVLSDFYQRLVLVVY